MKNIAKKTLRKVAHLNSFQSRNYNFNRGFKPIDFDDLSKSFNIDEFLDEHKRLAIEEELDVDQDVLRQDLQKLLNNEYESDKSDAKSASTQTKNQTVVPSKFEAEEEEDSEDESEVLRNIQMKIQKEFQEKRAKEQQMIDKFSKKNKKESPADNNEKAKQLQRLSISKDDLKRTKTKKDKNTLTTGQMHHSRKIKDVLQFVIRNVNQDELIKKVEIREVYLNKDFRSAKIKYEVPKKHAKVVKKTLKKISGFLSSQVGQRLEYKYAPKFTWFTDVDLSDPSNNRKKIIKEIQEGIEELKKLGFTEKELKEYYQKELKDEFI